MEAFLEWLQFGVRSEISVTILSGIIALLSAYALENLRTWIATILGVKKKEKTETYSAKLSTLTESLTKASGEVDSLLVELSRVASERESAVKKLESDLIKLEEHEKQLQQRIKDLQNIPVPVAEHFATIIAQGEKKSAYRDYMLFGLGVVVSTTIAVILRLMGLG